MQAGDIFAVEQNAVVLLRRARDGWWFRRRVLPGRAVVEREAGAQRLKGEGAIHGAGFKVEQAKMAGQMAGDGALARAGGPVDGDDDLAGGQRGSGGSLSGLIRAFWISAWPAR